MTQDSTTLKSRRLSYLSQYSTWSVIIDIKVKQENFSITIVNIIIDHLFWSYCVWAWRDALTQQHQQQTRTRTRTNLLIIVHCKTRKTPFTQDFLVLCLPKALLSILLYSVYYLVILFRCFALLCSVVYSEYIRSADKTTHKSQTQ